MLSSAISFCLQCNEPTLPSSLVTVLCFVFLIDWGIQGDLPLSLHHMARLWGPGVSCLLFEFPLQGPGVRFVGPRPRPLGGPLQRWDRTLRNLRLGGHLPGPGRCGGGWWQPDRITVKEKSCLQRGWSQTSNIYIENKVLLQKRFKL